MPPERVVHPDEAAELDTANRDLRQLARDIAAGDAGPQVLRRRIQRRQRAAGTPDHEVPTAGPAPDGDAAETPYEAGLAPSSVSEHHEPGTH